jgi:hypothetical protein
LGREIKKKSFSLSLGLCLKAFFLRHPPDFMNNFADNGWEKRFRPGSLERIKEIPLRSHSPVLINLLMN